VHYFVGGATKLYGPRCTAAQEDFGELRHRDGHLAGVADSLRRDGALLHRGRADLPRARRARRGPTEPPAGAPYPFPAVSHEPRIQQLSDDLEAAGHHPFHAPVRVMLDEPTCPTAPACAVRPATAFPCLVHAKSDAEVLGVRPR
jgi:hypothetical protein